MAMFESLQEGLFSAFKTLRGKGKLTEANMRDGLRIVERSLLDADVSYSVASDFMSRVGERALGQKVLLALDPSQQLIGIVYEELVALLGPVDASLRLRKETTTIMLCGLQGSGKTTTCGKLAKLLLDNKARPLMVAADLQRPAAIEQLHVLGQQLGVPVYSEQGAQDPVKVCQNGRKKAEQEGANVVILDTAGRLAIDKELMDQLKRIDDRVSPDQVYLVVDGMTGQDAVNSASAFNEALELDGVIMTKLDGDTRGGALLSVKHVTGVPIKFIGVGERLDALEPFRPEGMASRILGQGDVLALVDQAKKIVDEKEQAELERKMREGQFTLEDFKATMLKIAQPGLMQKMIGLLPGMGQLKDLMGDMNAEGELKRTIGIIDSMTPGERRNPKIIDPSRRNRIAKGAGVQVQDVNQLIKQYDVMKPIMTKMAGQGLAGRLAQVKELQQSGLFNPGKAMPTMKKDTGQRLTSKERARLKKERERLLRKKKRDARNDKRGPAD
jgi:signal recognition particle subunit SRP54